MIKKIVKPKQKDTIEYIPNRSRRNRTNYTENRAVLERVIKALQKGSCAFVEGERSWYNLRINMTKLVWARNLTDGWNIDVWRFDEKGRDIQSGTIAYRPQERMNYTVNVYE